MCVFLCKSIWFEPISRLFRFAFEIVRSILVRFMCFVSLYLFISFSVSLICFSLLPAHSYIYISVNGKLNCVSAFGNKWTQIYLFLLHFFLRFRFTFATVSTSSSFLIRIIHHAQVHKRSVYLDFIACVYSALYFWARALALLLQSFVHVWYTRCLVWWAARFNALDFVIYFVFS